jgi:hypothetical protein
MEKEKKKEKKRKDSRQLTEIYKNGGRVGGKYAH